MRRIALAGIAGLLSLGSVHAATLIPVPQVPGSTYTSITAINDSDVIVGFYGTSDGAQHGFFGTLDGNYTTVDLSATSTELRGINDAGIIMGIANDANSEPQGFERYADGSTVFVTLKHGAPTGYAIDGGINSDGIFVASGWDQNFTQFQGFYGKNAQYTRKIEVPGSFKTYPRGIDDSNDVVGFYSTPDQPSTYHGFLLENGVVTTIDYPDPTEVSTELYGINKHGLIAGGWTDQKGNPYAFLYDTATGEFTSLEEKHVKHGKLAQTLGLNNDGLVAVNFVNGPFIYCPRKASTCPAGGFEIADGPVVPAGVVLARKAPPRHNAAPRRPAKWRAIP